MKAYRYSILFLMGLMSLFSSVWARPQGGGGNPFAPLPEKGRVTTPVAQRPEVVSQSYSQMAEHKGVINGILWHAQRPVAVLQNKPMTVGTYLGAGRISAIRPNAVEVTHDNGEVILLHMTGGLVSATPTEAPDEREDWLHLHMEEVSCRVVMESLAYQADLNVIFLGDVERPIRLHMMGVSRQEAAEAVLRAGGCSMTWEGRTITVQDQREILLSQTFPLNYGKSKDMGATVQKLLSEQGRVGIDERLNALIVTDTTENLERIKGAIKRLDTMAPQVMIEVLIVNVILSAEFKMGVDWQVVGSKAAGEGVALAQNLSNTGPGIGKSLVPPLTPSGAVGFYLVDGDWSFGGLLDFIHNRDDVTVLASPKVLVLNNQKATIDAVEEIPYEERTQTGQGVPIGTTAFKEAGVKLEVTPQITEDGYIVMHIMPEQSARTGTFTLNGSETPVVETRKTETNLRVKDGQTVIIGGLRKKEPFTKESRVPFLSDLPLLGKLFRHTHLKEVDSELAVFITPHIYRDELPDGGDLELVDSQDDLATLWKQEVIPNKTRAIKE